MAQWRRKDFSKKEGRGFVVDINEVKKRARKVVVGANMSGTVKITRYEHEYLASVRLEFEHWVERTLATEWLPPEAAERIMVHDGVAASDGSYRPPAGSTRHVESDVATDRRTGKIAYGDIVVQSWKHNECEITVIQSETLFVMRIKPPAAAQNASPDERIAYAKTHVEPLFIKQANIQQLDGTSQYVQIRELILADLFQDVDSSELDGAVCIGKLPKHFTAPKREACLLSSRQDHTITQYGLSQDAGYYTWYECVGWWSDGNEIIVYFPKIAFYQNIKGQTPQGANWVMHHCYRFGHNWFLLDPQ